MMKNKRRKIRKKRGYYETSHYRYTKEIQITNIVTNNITAELIYIY